MSGYHRQKIDPEVLINALIGNAQANGNRPLEQRLADLTVWFYRNRKFIDVNNIHKRMKLFEDGFWILLEVNALLMDRVQEIENQRKSASLWLPRGMKIEGDLVTNPD
jgi:hypothetical protein